MHNLTQPEEWDTAMGPDGALEALLEAKDAGLTRFIGVTGHGSVAEMHLKSLERYEFDSVLISYNYVLMQDSKFAQYFPKLVEVCKQRNVALQTIKSVARKPWTTEKRRTTWYEPFEDQADIKRAVSWVLGNPDVFLITAGDVNSLPRVLEAASNPDPRPSDASMESWMKEKEMDPIFDGRETIRKS
jgi:predicted aldo/keto reductase-like oxidoreductase